MKLMNSDALGEKGEQRFGELCADASLLCNRATRDRTGWDYIIEFPFPSSMPVLLLERRPQPPECRVQVKTVWSESKYIKLRLSSAERLAKLRQPTCIFVPEVDRETLGFHKIFGLHVMDDVLSRILKEFRQCLKANSTKVNKTFIRLPFRELGEAIDISGRALEDYILAACGGDLDTYVRKKLDQVANLGVTGSRYAGQFTLHAKSEAEVADVFLGLKKGKVSDFRMEEIRWGIALPTHEQDTDGEILISPTPLKGEMLLRSKSLNEAVMFKVDIYVSATPGILSGSAKVRVSSPILDLTLERDQANVSAITGTHPPAALTLDEHIKLNKAQRILSGVAGTLELRTRRKPVLRLEFSTSTTNIEAGQLHFAQGLLSKLKAIVTASGGGELRLTVSEINAQIARINFLYELLNNPGDIRVNPVTIEATDAFPEELNASELLVIGRMVFSQSQIAFCAIGDTTISGEKPHKVFSIAGLNLRQLDLLDADLSSYEDFENGMQDETALKVVLKLEDVAA